MKFATGVTTGLLALGGASAFVPQGIVSGSRPAKTTKLSITATEPVYTFTKSEEIFAEALEVGNNDDANKTKMRVMDQSSVLLTRMSFSYLMFFLGPCHIFDIVFY